MTQSCPYRPDDRVEYAYAEMPVDKSVLFEAHLKTCATCQQEIATYKAASSICRQVRDIPIPKPTWTKKFTPSKTQPKTSWIKRPLFWLPVAAVASAALAFMLIKQPTVARNIDIPPPGHQLETWDEDEQLKVSELTGQAFLRHNSNEGSIPLRVADLVHPGDTLITTPNATIRLELADGSQIQLHRSSALSLKATRDHSDAFRLKKGKVSCQVQPRNDQKPFLVLTDMGQVRVVGTAFSVELLSGKKRMQVGVQKGTVAVKTNTLTKSFRDDHEMLIDKGWQLTVLDNGKTNKQKLPDEHASASQTPKRAERQKPPAKTSERVRHRKTRVAKAQAPQTSAASRLPKDERQKKSKPVQEPSPSHQNNAQDGHTGKSPTTVAKKPPEVPYAFVKLRQAADHGQCKSVLERVAFYLSDPQSQKKSEAFFLKAYCLEKLGNTEEANHLYRQYKLRWPGGAHAEEALVGAIRTRQWD